MHKYSILSIRIYNFRNICVCDVQYFYLGKKNIAIASLKTGCLKPEEVV